MPELLRTIPEMDLILGLAVLLAAAVAAVTGRRGGHYRGLPGWAGFWLGFALLLILLSLAPRWVSFPLLGALMYALLRVYFFVAPVRPADRWAILACYVGIPFVLYPAYIGRSGMFMAACCVQTTSNDALTNGMSRALPWQ